MADERCIICEQVVESDRSEVRKKGIEGLVRASEERNDGKKEKLKKLTSGVVHSTCRKNYTRPANIAAFVKAEQPSTSQTSRGRAGVPQFDFKRMCFFCGDPADEEFLSLQKQNVKATKRDSVYEVRSLEMKAKVLEQATKRRDDWGQVVSTRVNIVGDLVAAEGRYHNKCCKKFFSKMETGVKRGRPVADYVAAAMEEVETYIRENDECQFALDELMDAITGEKPSPVTVKDRLKQIYGDRLIITQLHGQTKTVLCFTEVGHKILNESWYNSRERSNEEERMRLVRTAAIIIKEDVQKRAYDTTRYPPIDGFLDGVEEDIPPTLSTFLEVLLQSRTRDRVKAKRKEMSLAHAIISAIRPRSFISSIMHGIAFFIHRKFGSKSLVNLLSNLGLCGSYNDAQMLELSAIHAPQQPTPPDVFTQYVFDNADYNVATLDGLRTFHSMGGIKCLNPARKLPPAQPIEKMKRVPSADQVGTLGVIPLKTYENIGKVGLKGVAVEDLGGRFRVPDFPFPSLSDVLWICGQWLKVDGIPEWKGYIRGVHEGAPPEKSAILPLPFINAPPSDYNTIYSALHFAATVCQEEGMKTCYVTFDLPLYIKAREIVASCHDDPLLKSVVVRLGGFHLLMSYMGSIGYIMAGSGLKEALCTIFASNSVDKMLTGHAFSRAVRGHLLVHTVLASIILDSTDIEAHCATEIREMLTKLRDGTLTTDVMEQNAYLALLRERLKTALLTWKERGPTAALWIQYFHMISLMKQFIEAERSGNWESHLCSIQQMIPLFHASGHMQYAKCAHLYVQDMRALASTHADTFQEFATNGCFTVSRSGAPGSGNWSDMTIEMTLMRSMKTHGGLTSGRGITNSVLAKWVAGAPASTSICSALEDFAGLHMSSGEQHVDYRTSRQSRNKHDRNKLFEWFAQHPPFPESLELVSISTGVVATSDVNCHRAIEEGKKSMMKLIGQQFGDIKQTRKDKVLPLASMSCTIKVHAVVEVVDPLLIFQRVAVAKQSDEDLRDILCYELSPFPLALFDIRGMRKTKKAALYNFFPTVETSSPDLKLTTNVIDGGFLLHRVKWNAGGTFSSICGQYITYVKKHYGERCTVVFDGYEDTASSTKHVEQKRRTGKTASVNINFTREMVATVQQEQFLGNEKNKANFIRLLAEEMMSVGIESRQSEADADTLIVRCGVEKATSNENVAIVGEDVDLVVLLTALAPPSTNILFVKPGKGAVPTKTFSSTQLQQLDFANSLLFIHAFSGCDTTSSIYRKGKSVFVKMFRKDSSLSALADVFNRPSSTPQEVAEAGERMFLALYSAQQQDLNAHRYSAFLRSTMKVKPDLPSLPPTKASAQQHAYRVFLQIQTWLGNPLTPCDWGWEKGLDGKIQPITTLAPVAPATILEAIFCTCKTGCGSRCGCRKAGITCTTVCANCEGACTNGPAMDDDEIYEEIDDPDTD